MKIKKQYLISLLWLAMIAIPIGNSNLIDETNSKKTNSTNSTSPITIDEESEVVVFDTGINKGEVSEGDTLESIKFSAKCDFKGDLDLSPNDPNIIIYQGKEKIVDVPYMVLDLKLGGNYNNETNVFSLSLNSKDDSEFIQIWEYVLINSSDFEIKYMNTNNNEILIGSIKINETPLDYTSSLPTVEPKNFNIAQTSASVDYEITPPLNAAGISEDVFIVKKVEWLDFGDDGDLDTGDDEIIDVINEDDLTGTNDDLTGTLFRNELDNNHSSLIRVTYSGEDSFSKTTPPSVDSYIIDSFIPLEEANPKDNIEHIYIDNENGILSVEGIIISGGHQINSITIYDELKESTVGTTTIIEEEKNNELGINYEVHTFDYDGNLENYEVVINYDDNLSNSISLSNFNPLLIEEKDLSNSFFEYEDDNNDNNGLGAGAIIGIIIGTLILVGVLIFVGLKLLKKYKEKKVNKEKKEN